MGERTQKGHKWLQPVTLNPKFPAQSTWSFWSVLQVGLGHASQTQLKMSTWKNSRDTTETACQIRYGVGGRWSRWQQQQLLCANTYFWKSSSCPHGRAGARGRAGMAAWTTNLRGGRTTNLRGGRPLSPSMRWVAIPTSLVAGGIKSASQSGPSPDPSRGRMLSSGFVGQQSQSITQTPKLTSPSRCRASPYTQSCLSLCNISGPCKGVVSMGKHSASHPSPFFRARWKLALESSPQHWNNTEIMGLALNYLSSALPIIHCAQMFCHTTG